MGFGKFSLYYKSALMLQAQRDIAELQFASYPDLKKDARERIWRGLKQTATEFMFKEQKDYKEVVKNLALNLMRQKNG